MPPAVPVIWEAMNHDDQRAAASFNVVYFDAVVVGVMVTYLLCEGGVVVSRNSHGCCQ